MGGGYLREVVAMRELTVIQFQSSYFWLLCALLVMSKLRQLESWG